jgi:hypothetical protein
MFKQKFHHNKIVDFTLKAVIVSEMILVVFGLSVAIINLFNGNFNDDVAWGIYG